MSRLTEVAASTALRGREKKRPEPRSRRAKTSQRTPPVLKRALEHEAAGRSVVVLAEVKKHPAGSSWRPFTRRRATQGELQAKLRRHPTRGIALIMGGISGGMCCVDVDPDPYRRWPALGWKRGRRKRRR